MTGSDQSKRPRRARRPASDVVQAGRDPFAHHGFVNTPVYRGSTVLFRSLESFEKRDQRYVYGRRGTPTSEALEGAIAHLEGGARTWLAPSGAAAIATALMCFTKTGDHILVADTVYQPTRKICDGPLKRFGVETTYYDPTIGAGIARLMRPNTALVYTESPGSLTFEVQDIPALAAAAHAAGALVVLDNTWASPLYFKPFAHGADISIQAGTKYIVGHADAMLGAITVAEPLAQRLVAEAGGLGICAGTEEMYLGLRGYRTLDVRLERHWRSGVEVARWLEGRPEVARVLHPALPSHPQHALWERDFLGASGLFSIVLKPYTKTAVAALIEGLELFGLGASWGGYESLVLPFDAAKTRSATIWAPEGPTVRLHIGLEDVADLKADLEAGFARLATS
ncbi:MAG TPA: cystathionine beta-lyase [Hyphomicrobiaceae bacterium]|jgi:cystathionine beta-lyase|nr:cystathionine beta-lyase [Hyphomicrobiaceae bacterium]